MHELSIAQSILEIVESELEKNNAKKLRELELEIGKLAGVEYEPLEFALKAIASNTVLEDANIIIQKPDGLAFCKQCNKEFELTSFFGQCPDCNLYNYEIKQGKELRVKSLLID